MALGCFCVLIRIFFQGEETTTVLDVGVTTFLGNKVRFLAEQLLLADEPQLRNSYDFDRFFTKLENETRTIHQRLINKDSNGRSVAQKLAGTLEIDNRRGLLSDTALFNSLFNYGVSNAFDDLELNEANAQEVLGSFLETIDTLARISGYQDSKIGESDGQVSLNIDRLEDLHSQFFEMTRQILSNVSGTTFRTLKSLLKHCTSYFDTNMVDSFDYYSSKKTKTTV